jgi:hypothetical protein
MAEGVAPNQSLQPTAAAMLVWQSFWFLSAAAAAELGCSAPHSTARGAPPAVAPAVTGDGLRPATVVFHEVRRTPECGRGAPGVPLV